MAGISISMLTVSRSAFKPWQHSCHSVASCARRPSTWIGCAKGVHMLVLIRAHPRELYR